MAPISHLPDDIILLIFELGCEDIRVDEGSWHEQRLSSILFKSRRPKPFVDASAIVCWRWRNLVFSNSRLHITQIAFSDYIPSSPALPRISLRYQTLLNRAQGLLASSAKSDIDFTLEIKHHASIPTAAEFLKSHVWPYAENLRSFSLFSRLDALEASLSEHDAQISMPRLRKLSLIGFTAYEVWRLFPHTPNLSYARVEYKSWSTSLQACVHSSAGSLVALVLKKSNRQINSDIAPIIQPVIATKATFPFLLELHLDLSLVQDVPEMFFLPRLERLFIYGNSFPIILPLFPSDSAPNSPSRVSLPRLVELELQVPLGSLDGLATIFDFSSISDLRIYDPFWYESSTSFPSFERSSFLALRKLELTLAGEVDLRGVAAFFRSFDSRTVTDLSLNISSYSYIIDSRFHFPNLDRLCLDPIMLLRHFDTATPRILKTTTRDTRVPFMTISRDIGMIYDSTGIQLSCIKELHLHAFPAPTTPWVLRKDIVMPFVYLERLVIHGCNTADFVALRIPSTASDSAGHAASVPYLPRMTALHIHFYKNCPAEAATITMTSVIPFISERLSLGVPIHSVHLYSVPKRLFMPEKELLTLRGLAPDVQIQSA